MFDVQAGNVRVMVVKLFAGQLDVEQSVVILPPNREGALTSFFKVAVFARGEDQPFRWRSKKWWNYLSLFPVTIFKNLLGFVATFTRGVVSRHHQGMVMFS